MVKSHNFQIKLFENCDNRNSWQLTDFWQLQSIMAGDSDGLVDHYLSIFSIPVLSCTSSTIWQLFNQHHHNVQA